jgi:hypothetical protein
MLQNISKEQLKKQSIIIYRKCKKSKPSIDNYVLPLERNVNLYL